MAAFGMHAAINAFLIDEDWWDEPAFTPGTRTSVIALVDSFAELEIPTELQAAPLEDWDGGTTLRHIETIIVI